MKNLNFKKSVRIFSLVYVLLLMINILLDDMVVEDNNSLHEILSFIILNPVSLTIGVASVAFSLSRWENKMTKKA